MNSLLSNITQDAQFGLVLLGMLVFVVLLFLCACSIPRGSQGSAPKKSSYLVDGTACTEEQLITFAQRCANKEGKGQVILTSVFAGIVLRRNGHRVERIDVGCGCGKLHT